MIAKRRRLILTTQLLGLVLLLSVCVNQTLKSTSVPAINTSSEAIPEGQLLDVGIAIFDPGLEEYDEDERVYPEVRKAESRFMPNLLSQAMQESGAWGKPAPMPTETPRAVPTTLSRRCTTP